MSDVTIRLDYADLSRLFGGDDPPAVVFKNAVADRFAQTFLKSLVNQKLNDQFMIAIDAEIKRVLGETVLEETTKIGTFGQKSISNRLQPYYRDLVAVAVNAQLERLLTTAADEAITKVDNASRKALDKIESALNDRIASTVAKAVEEAKLEDLVKRALDRNLHYVISRLLDQVGKQDESTA